MGDDEDVYQYMLSHRSDKMADVTRRTLPVTVALSNIMFDLNGLLAAILLYQAIINF